MMRPKVIHVRNIKPEDIFIGRPSPYGNPFVIGRHGSRLEVIELYRRMITRLDPRMNKLREQIIEELRGRNLACFCAPLPCHGDILLEIANRVEDKNASEPTS